MQLPSSPWIRRKPESENRFRTLSEASPVGIYRMNVEGLCTYANSRWSEITGLKVEQALGKGWEKSLHPDDRRAVAEAWNGCLKENRSFEVEYRLVRPGGEVIWVLGKAVSVSDTLGKISGYIGVLVDITKRRETERKLLEKSHEMEVLLASIPDIYFRMDEKGTILDYHAPDESCLYVPPDTFMHRSMFELLPKDVSENFRVILSRVVNSQAPAIMEYDLQMPKGKCKFEARIQPLPERQVMALIRDVTKSREAEEQLKLQGTIIANLAEGVALVRESDSIIVFTNPMFDQLFGYKAGELSGKLISSLDTPGEKAPEEIYREILASLNENGVWSGEINKFKKDGTSFWSYANISRFEHNEYGTVWLAIHTDISQRKRIELELTRGQKLESVGVLAGGIAHDFNNILTILRGKISHALLHLKPGDKVFTMLEDAEKATIRANALTQQLLTFSKGGDPVKSTIHPRSLIEESARFSLSGSNVTSVLSFPDALPAVDIDEGQMSQVINNIVINADQAMPGGGTLKVAAENVDVSSEFPKILRPGKYVKISFEDQGAGIAEEFIQKIFDPFFTRKPNGSGLGLAISYAIIKKHDGHISVKSTQGEGATFTLYLPASEKSPSLATNSASSLVVGRGRGSVLLMEDEELVALYVVELLEELGYTVTRASSGEEAIEKYAEVYRAGRPFGLVIMDLTIKGGMGGKEAVKKLHEVDSQATVIVSSGYSNDPVMSDYAAYGFVAALAKPYSSSDLAEIVSRVIKKK